jgi:hypothetical protein
LELQDRDDHHKHEEGNGDSRRPASLVLFLIIVIFSVLQFQVLRTGSKDN